MKEGFYRVDFTGVADWGFGLIALDTGEIVGCDIGGGIFDGTYDFNHGTNTVDATVTFTATEAVGLVQGVTLAPGQTFGVRVSFPKDAEGVVVQADTDLGPVNVKMTCLREF